MSAKSVASRSRPSAAPRCLARGPASPARRSATRRSARSESTAAAARTASCAEACTEAARQSRATETSGAAPSSPRHAMTLPNKECGDGAEQVEFPLESGGGGGVGRARRLAVLDGGRRRVDDWGVRDRLGRRDVAAHPLGVAAAGSEGGGGTRAGARGDPTRRHQLARDTAIRLGAGERCAVAARPLRSCWALGGAHY